METYFSDSETHASIDIETSCKTHITASRRHNDGVRLHVSRRIPDCGVEATICISLTCEEYERLLCELARVECGHRPCCEGRVRVFDQDDCEEQPKRRTATTNAKGGK